MSTRRRGHLAHQTFEMHPANAETRVANRIRGKVRCAPRRTKVAIIGAGLGAEQAPYDDPAWEVWALNVVGSFDAQGRLRADRWFELHEMKAQSEDDLAWISRCPVPIYLVPQAFETAAGVALPDGMVWAERRDVPSSHLIACPHAVRFPLEVLEARFGKYWTCTFAYQMALALHEGFTDVGLFGVELSFGTARERSVEFACVSWWLGYLEGHGVQLHLPGGSMLGQHRHRYGIEYDEEKAWVERYVRVTERRAAAGVGG